MRRLFIELIFQLDDYSEVIRRLSVGVKGFGDRYSVSR